MPLSLSRATIFRRQKNPRRVYRPKIAGILFVCNEPEGKYYTVPYSWLVKVLGQFSIIYFRGLGLRIGVRIWVRVRVGVRVWVRVRVRVRVRVSVVLWSG